MPQLKTVPAISPKQATVSYAADFREKTNVNVTGPAHVYSANIYLTEIK